jgi:hypothetical protein
VAADRRRGRGGGGTPVREGEARAMRGTVTVTFSRTTPDLARGAKPWAHVGTVP